MAQTWFSGGSCEWTWERAGGWASTCPSEGPGHPAAGVHGMRRAYPHGVTTGIMLGPASIQSQPVYTEKPAWAQLRTNASAVLFGHPSPKHNESLLCSGTRGRLMGPMCHARQHPSCPAAFLPAHSTLCLLTATCNWSLLQLFLTKVPCTSALS